MDWIEGESVWLFCPSFADELVGGEAFEGLEPPGVVVGLDEVVEVGSQRLVGFVVVALDGSWDWDCPGWVDPPKLSSEVLPMPKTPPPYSPEFRRQMVELVRAGRDPDDLARE